MEHLIKYKNFSESLMASSSFNDIIKYLRKVKRNKIAFLLSDLMDNNAYSDDEDLNWLSTTTEDNMISYLPNARYQKLQSNDIENIYNNSSRMTLRIGRAIKKIITRLTTTFEYEGNFRILNIRNRKNEIVIDFEGIYSKMSDLYVVNHDNMDTCGILDTKIYIDIDSPNKLNFIGDCVFYVNNDGYSTVSMEIKDAEMMKFAIQNFKKTGANFHSQIYDINGTRLADSRYDLEFDLNGKFKIQTDLGITDADIERFSNEYISIMKSTRSDKSSKIIEVKGEEIRKWYNLNNYAGPMGQLGSSCMADPNKRNFFDIYIDNNNQCSLLVLLNNDDKLLGRALLWKLDESCDPFNKIEDKSQLSLNFDKANHFMDRVYTINDSDANIFYNYAIQNNYIYRNTNNSKIKYFYNSSEIEKPILEVVLDTCHFDYYPYVDTLCWLDGHILSNYKSDGIELRDVDGRWIGHEDYDDE